MSTLTKVLMDAGHSLYVGIGDTDVSWSLKVVETNSFFDAKTMEDIKCSAVIVPNHSLNKEYVEINLLPLVVDALSSAGLSAEVRYPSRVVVNSSLTN